MILATGALLTFPTPEHSNSDCFTQGYTLLQKIAVYHGPGPNQAWIFKGSNIEVGGWYCQ